MPGAVTMDLVKAKTAKAQSPQEQENMHANVTPNPSSNATTDEFTLRQLLSAAIVLDEQRTSKVPFSKWLRLREGRKSRLKVQNDTPSSMR